MNWVFVLLFSSLIAQALMNGKPLVGNHDLVTLIFKNGWVCSGAYLDPFTILTAAHCLVDADGKATAVAEIRSVDNVLINSIQMAVITHPDYSDQFWPTSDIGIIKTTVFAQFEGNFKLAETASRYGIAYFFGCGRERLDSVNRARAIGTNRYIRLNNVLLAGGATEPSMKLGESVSIAPNDSGAPLTDLKTGLVIGVATQTTLSTSHKLGIPTLSLATFITNKSNLDFVKSHLDKSQKN